MQKKSFWPAWFPYPISLFRAFILTLLLVPLVYGGVQLGRTGTRLTLVTQSLGPLALLILIGLLLPFIFLAYVHHFTANRGKRPSGWPRHLPSPSSIWEGFFGLNVLLLSMLIMFVFIFFTHDLKTDRISDGESGFYLGVWFSVVAYFYQAEHLIRNFDRLTTHPSSPKPSTKGDDIDGELKRMKRGMGL